MARPQTGPASAPLSRLVDSLGPGVVHVLSPPGDPGVPVGQACIYDRADGRIDAGDVVLGVGIDAASGDALELLVSAGAARAAAVVLKIPSEPSPALLKAAQCADVALLAAAGELAWGQLHTLLRTAAATSGEAPEASHVAAPIGDLFALASAVAAMVGGPTTIEDRHSTVLAYSRHTGPIDEGRRQTILGRRVPDAWIERLNADGVFRRLWDSDEVVRLDYSAQGVRPRMVIAVRADREVLGTIWVAEGDAPLGEDAATALREAARVAALHLIRHRSGEDLERRQQAELLRSALEGRTPPEQLAAALGIAADGSITVLAFELQSSERTELAVQAARTLNLLALYCEAFRRQAACVAIGRVIYVLIPESEPTGRSRLLRFVNDIVERARPALGISLRAGVGSTARGLAGMLTSRREADQVLRVLARQLHDRGVERDVADIDELRSHAVLLELCELAESEPALRAGRLQALLEADPEGKKGYVETLRAYLDAFGNIPAAAAMTQVHHNTFRHRLRRLQEQSGLNLHDPVERLVTELQLHFQHDRTG